MKSETIPLTKKLKELEAAISIQEAELKNVEQKVEYNEDKSTSIEMFTTVKVHAEMMKEFIKGKISSWNPKAEFKS